MKKKAHGIGLLSGGLDSTLAAKIVMDAGADVTCLHFRTGFCAIDHNRQTGRTDSAEADNVARTAMDVAVTVERIDVTREFLTMVTNPRYGYGANMNPCIDCRILTLSRAKKYMDENGADFVFTGEVIGQRPMSQMRHTLELTLKRSGLEGVLLRPLSAKLLDPTEIERKGLVDREKLLGLHGRSRKPQIELAKKFGITGYSAPSSVSCLLTDKNYAGKLRDFLGSSGGTIRSMDDVYVLGVGRHFRLSPDLKVVVGRDETENNFLERYAGKHWSARARDFVGPTAIIFGEPSQDSFGIVASLVARYCDGKYETLVTVKFERGETIQTVDAAPADNDRLEELRI